MNRAEALLADFFSIPLGRYRYRQRYIPKRTGERERKRRWLQDAQQNQINSHKPGTVQPRHIFGAGQ